MELNEVNHSGAADCANRDCKNNRVPMSLGQDVVGVNNAPYERAGKDYAVICKCCDCDKRSWYHLSDEMARYYKKRYELKCNEEN